MRGLVNWCLRRRSVVVLATIVILLAGSLAARELRQQLFPDIDFPFALATIDIPGQSASTLDTEVARPLGRIVGQLEHSAAVTSIAQAGAVRVYAQYEYGTDMDAARANLQEQLDGFRYPDGAGKPRIQGGFTSTPSVVADINAPDGDLRQLSEEADRLKSRLEALSGVSRVDMSGQVRPQYLVTLTPAAVRAGLTPAAIAGQLQGMQVTAPAGAVITKGAALPLIVQGSGIANRAALERLPLAGGARLGDIARIIEREDPTSGFATANGRPAISFSVYRSPSSNEVSVVDGINEELDKVEKRLGNGSVTTVFETASDIRESIHGLLLESALGALFAVIIIFIFLRSVRGTLIAAVSIPTSLVFGLLVAWAMGLTLDVITLAGLTIAIGRVIDDGIVVIENIHKHLERGEPRMVAAREGTAEVVTAIASSTLATAAVFLPIGLVGGLISEIFLSFSIIVSVALLASLLVATTIIPVLASLLLQVPANPDGDAGRLARMVTPATRFGIRHRWLVMLVAVATFVTTIGIVMAGAVPVQFLPESGTRQVTGTITLPPGTTVESAREKTKAVNEWLGEVKGRDTYTVSYGAPVITDDGSYSPSTASFFLNLKEGVDAERVVDDLRVRGKEQYPGAFTVKQLENGPPNQFTATIYAADAETLTVASDRLVEMLRKRSDVTEVASNLAQPQPQVIARVKPGSPVSPSQVQGAIAAVSAVVPAGSTADGRTISVEADPSLLSSTASLSRLPLASGMMTGAAGQAAAPGSLTSPATPALTLGSVATLANETSPSSLVRTDGRLAAVVTATYLTDNVRKANIEIRDDSKRLELKGAEIDFEQGSQQFINEMFKDLGLAMLAAIVLVYLVLVVFFGSISVPLAILAPVLFSTIGSLLALAITGNAFGLPAMIGILLLIGIVVSNSILLVDTAIQKRRAGLEREDALVGSARLRVRPVLMTAAATIAALTPLAFGLSGSGGIISQSLGIVVIGGLLVATLLTLVIVPAAYTLLSRRQLPTSELDDAPTHVSGNGSRVRSTADVG